MRSVLIHACLPEAPWLVPLPCSPLSGSQLLPFCSCSFSSSSLPHPGPLCLPYILYVHLCEVATWGLWEHGFSVTLMSSSLALLYSVCCLSSRLLHCTLRTLDWPDPYLVHKMGLPNSVAHLAGWMQLCYSVLLWYVCASMCVCAHLCT